MTPQFRSGQAVRFANGLRYSTTTGNYQIVKRLPEDGGEQQYIVKSVLEPHERVAKESELEKA
jgi:hypothetical protein